MNRVFADTFYWLAISSPTDQWRTAVLKSVAVLDNLSIVTTEEVLTEFLAGMARRISARTRNSHGAKHSLG